MSQTIDLNSEYADTILTYVATGDVHGIRVIGPVTYTIVRTYEYSGWFVVCENDYGQRNIFRFDTEAEAYEYLDGICDDSPQ